MNTTPSLFESSIIGIDYIANRHIPQTNNFLTIQNSSLRKKILENLKHEVGTSILKLSLEPEDLIRYKDGSFSSMIKGSKGIAGHSGFELMQTADIVDHVMFEVENSYTQRMLHEYNRATKEMLYNVQRFQMDFMNYFCEQLDQEHIDQLNSAISFLRELHDDLEDISFSPQRKTAYLHEVITIRRTIHKTNNYFLRKLQWQINFVESHTNYNLQIVNNYYMQCRAVNSCYAACVALEYILSGCVTEKNINSAVSKIEKFVQDFSYEIERLKKALGQRSNYLNNWANGQYYYLQAQSAREEANWLLATQQNYQNNPELEINTIKELFANNKHFLDNILILED